QPVDAATRHHASHSGAWGTPDRSLRRLGYPGLRRVNGRGKPDVSERRQVYTRLRIALPGAIPTVDGRAHRHTVAHTTAHSRSTQTHAIRESPAANHIATGLSLHSDTGRYRRVL